MHIYGLIVLTIVMTFTSVVPFPENRRSTSKCGYESCNPVKDGMLNVHIIPNTHDDVGWTKTYSEYYNNDVRRIISSVVENLSKDRIAGGRRRFVYVEMAFMKLWWEEQNLLMKSVVRELVDEGYLEFILGGWCMNDEATPYYVDIIDQHTLGFEFIRLNFGDCGRPKVGWQIDPFGHSREVASLFAQFGFDGMFIGRIDYQDKTKREATHTMEMVWTTSDSLGRASDIFVGVLNNVYWPPKGFCWDYWCSDPEIYHSTPSFQKSRMDAFILAVEEEASHYGTNHVMIEFGGDFQYRLADKWYQNLDVLIALFNQRQQEDPSFKINLLYSTPSCYLHQLHLSNTTWTRKADDFFPYAHREHSFWTGYYTSRPHLKRLVRTAGSMLQSCKQLAALALLEDAEMSLNYLKEAMAVLQHHDAVSGTEKQYVADDYTRLLRNGMFYCKEVINTAINKILASKEMSQSPEFDHCGQLSLQACPVTETASNLTMIVYNPIARTRNYFVQLPIPDAKYSVYNSSGHVVKHQTLPVSMETKRIPERPRSVAEKQLVFETTIPALGIATYFVEIEVDHQSADAVDDDVDLLEEDIIELAEESFGPEPYEDAIEMIENQYYTVTVNRVTGLISRLWNKQEDVAMSLEQNFFYYVGHEGYNYDGNSQASGAYIFRPTSDTPQRANLGQAVSIVSYKGSMVQEIRQVFCPWISQVIRLYNDKDYVELEWTVGPIPSGKGYEGREVITKYISDLETDGVFYTDLNGRETLKRRRNVRETWSLNQTENVAGNYYPITSRTFVREERRGLQFTVLVDRSEGAASIQDGELEIMVHRRTFHDDSLGVQEPLTEYGASGRGIVARGKHFIMLNKVATAAAVYRPLYQEVYLQPTIVFSKHHTTFTEWSDIYSTQWSGVQVALPENVHLLTLDMWPNPPVETKHTAILLRLEHIFEKFEDRRQSSPARVYLRNLFVPFYVVDVVELTLGANMKKEDLRRFQWKSDDDRTNGFTTVNQQSIGDDLMIEMSPMEIRTFQINIQPTEQ